MEQARQFKRWITSEVLPSIRKTGQYKLELQKTEALVNFTQKWDNQFGLDDRDRVILKDLYRNQAKRLLKNDSTDDDNDEWSISRRLGEYFNVTDKQTHNQVTVLGKKMKQKYIEINGRTPPMRNDYVNGQEIRHAIM
jgi:prophage antirepressor-like protein